MKFEIYYVGKIKDKSHNAAIGEYSKRLTKYCNIKHFSLKNSDMLLKKLSKKSYIIKLSTSGYNPSSEELADKINVLGITGKSEISIIITDDEIDCDEHLSLSPMTFSLGMTMTVLYEQIYRAYRIIHGHTYHK